MDWYLYLMIAIVVLLAFILFAILGLNKTSEENSRTNQLLADIYNTLYRIEGNTDKKDYSNN